ncbi:MAG: PaaI family thioesterase [Candidatus Delongbacteria bacterium]|nr:PaaI family thioesterase [Candidatus Delongbacteria bacterium]MCG2760988.1 PaaI family thioesterase [Candidatus Delongbacteria bacterium]
MKVEDDAFCFVCGDKNNIGLHANFTVNDNNSASARLVIPSDYQGWAGIVHGGIISTLLDEVSIYACRKISTNGVTAEINVKFKKPVPTEKEIFLTAKVVEIKRRLILVQAELVCDGQVHADAETKVFILDMK